VAAFSLATDLGLGQPMEHVLRSWLIAVRLGERLGLGAEAWVPLYYVMVLAWVGCVADSAEVAAWFGDDIALRSDSYRVDLAGLGPAAVRPVRDDISPRPGHAVPGPACSERDDACAGTAWPTPRRTA
jgi:hypothetical protein